MMLVSIVRKMRLKTQANRWHLIRKNKHPTRTNIYVTGSSWLNCALRDDEAVYWVSIGYFETLRR